MSIPNFKYNPNPVELGVIKKERTFCPVCEKERDYSCVGPFYSVEEVEGICPWCIKDGSAAEKFDGEFQDAASCEEVEQEEFLFELIYRTPGYIGWQQEQWLSHCGDFCKILCYVDWDDIKHLEQELLPDIEKHCEEYNLTTNEFKSLLKHNSRLQGYLFQCGHCHRHRLHVDFN